ncbi:hypothetical protein GPECTOR_25g348 [Gonium pectorale]|uniref:SGNH hydrolase-type esterase domain-containing protein n=1 Tax=Gonium pectorale TaxID=33097 RepID=A0A150GG23_GONPE|nr:hypothetical protein GPECTOR_25g348 [Gonium pectorale]|eukprot:KXZ48764.1 hypothetical protein GPECTOR_25g348 [Gonium pectorale]
MPPGGHVPGEGEGGAGGAGGLDAGPAANASCGEPVCYQGMVEFAKGACKAHEYLPGLFKMMTDANTRQMAQSSAGDRSRLLAALERFRDGQNLTVAIVGGSISAGQGAYDAPAYPAWLRMILEAQMPGGSARVKVHNGAVPGTSSQYMSACHNVHVPRDADIVFLEYAINDDEMPMPHMDNKVRRPYERLVRKLLTYPRRPAVVLFHAFRWFQLPVDLTGTFWMSSERQHGEFGLYYGLPQLSVKACCYHHMVAGKEGYQVKRPRANPNGRLDHENFADSQLKGNAFFFDIVHPDGNTGHRIMAELAAQVVLDVWAQVAAGYKVTDEQKARVTAELPAPMLKGNFESRTDKCFIGPAFQQTVIHTNGFAWVNEGKNPQLPKWGYVSDVPGMDIKFKINTMSSAGKTNDVIVELGYLRSYENMGKAAVACEGGCRCEPWFLDGIQEARNSQTFLQAFKVSQAEECIIADTTSGKHKVKLTGLMVSEEPDSHAFNNWAAWDWVAMAASKDSKGVFEIGNIARRRMMEAHAASSAELMRRYHSQLAAAAVAGGAVEAGEGEAQSHAQDEQAAR